MLDIEFIRNNKKAVSDSIKQRGTKVDLGRLLKLDDQRRELLTQTDKLRHQRNQSAKTQTKPGKAAIDHGKQLKSRLARLESKLKAIEPDYHDLLLAVPNILADNTPSGAEADNREEKKWGKAAKPKFAVKDHLELAKANNWVDFERGAKVAGNKFYYLAGGSVKLELALMRWAMDELAQAGFALMSTPHLVSRRIYDGTGFQPRGEEPQSYEVKDDDLILIGTAEIPLTGYHADEIIDPQELPKMYAALTPSYRKEAGSYGQHAKGLFRVHQFNKLEMYIVCAPADSEQYHQQLLGIEERLYQKLGLPYRITRTAAGDLGAPAFKKYDLEYWSPVDGRYREITSCSNCTDFQARRLNIRARDQQGNTVVAHTLNGTAIAGGRTLIAIIENYQTKDGRVRIPKILHKYMKEKYL